jgi:phosphonate transport system substrate-binding protein
MPMTSQRRENRRAVLALALSALVFAGGITLLVLAAARGERETAPAGLPAQASRPGTTGGRVLRFGKIPNVSAREASRDYSDLLTLLNRRLSCCRLELVLAPDYQSCMDMLAAGEVEAAWIGIVPYMNGRGQIPMAPIVRPIWSGERGYRGILFTVEDSGIRSLGDLKGKRLALVDKDSASGYLYPAVLLAREGLDLARDFKAVDFLGTHDAVVMAVLLGEYEAGAVFERAYATVADRAKRLSFRTLARTDPIPGEPIVVRKDLDAGIVEELTEAFLSLSPEELAGCRLADLFGFEAVSEAPYEGIDLPELP